MSLNRYAPPIAAVHIDLKGVLFRPSYIETLFSDLAGQGVNAVLVEYEDVFPFKGIDLAFDPKDRWSPAVLTRFLSAAATHRIEVIPLQQCLGHLEYIFRWNRFRRFSEDPVYPSTLCLSKPAGKALIADLLCQVMTAHPDSRFIHLGMDEAHKLATCPRCRRKGHVLSVFLDYLDELCDICTANGKTPMIWTDMLEDHFRPHAFKRFRDRVIMVPWDYAAHGAVDPVGRFAGFRTSRQWLNRPEDPLAPPISSSTPFIEDLPPALARAIRPYRKGNGFLPIYQARLWSDLGFRVLGASVVRASSHGPVAPDYTAIKSNIRTWSGIIRDTRQLGLIGTSWARGNTFCPPNFSIDLTWPSIACLTRQLGRTPRPFWPGVPRKTVDRLVAQIGRCCRDWRIEADLIREMTALRPRVREHRYEWDSLLLMLRVLSCHRRADYAHQEVTYFSANVRPVPREWQRRLDDQAALLRELTGLRREVSTHFGRRCVGSAYQEWLRWLFDPGIATLRECRRICLAKQRLAARQYGG